MSPDDLAELDRLARLVLEGPSINSREGTWSGRAMGLAQRIVTMLDSGEVPGVLWARCQRYEESCEHDAFYTSEAIAKKMSEEHWKPHGPCWDKDVIQWRTNEERPEVQELFCLYRHQPKEPALATMERPGIYIEKITADRDPSAG